MGAGEAGQKVRMALAIIRCHICSLVKKESQMTSLTEKAKIISRFRKERHLLGLTEDSFRDRVIRPLLLRKRI